MVVNGNKSDKDRDTVCYYDNLLKTYTLQIPKYVIDKEHTHDFVFCVATYACSFLLDKISYIVRQDYQLIRLLIIMNDLFGNSKYLDL